MKKWLAIAAGVGVLPAAAVFVIIVLLLAVLAGAIVSISTGLGSMFGDDDIQDQAGLTECESEGSSAGVNGMPTTGSQKEYVRTVIGVGKAKNVPKKGQIIAVMTMMQESNIQNHANNGENRLNFDGFPAPGSSFWLKAAKRSLKHPHDKVGNDADSVGLFQQRASASWADDDNFKAQDDPEKAIKRLLDPKWGAAQFYGGPGGSPSPGLLDIDGWESKTPGQAAQAVQGSALPDEYDKWERQATKLVNDNSDAPAISVGGGDSGGSGESEGSGGADEESSDGSNAEEASSDSSAITDPMKEGTYRISSPFGNRDSPGGVGSTDHKGQDYAGDLGTPILSAAAGTVAEAGSAQGFGQWVVINHDLNGKKVSTVYGHVKAGSIKVKKGDKVDKGQQVAGLGNEGTSTGPHLHFEVWDGGKASGKAIDPKPWLEDGVSGAAQDTSNDGCGDEGESDTVEAGSSDNGDADAVLKEWKGIVGTPYSWGGGTPEGASVGFGPGAGVKGFDCSSAVQYAIYQATGETLPRVAQAQYDHTSDKTVWKPGDPESKLKPGDLIFYGPSTSNINHVAMYSGNGKMYEAPRTGLDVRETKVRLDKTAVGGTRVDLSGSGGGSEGSNTSTAAAQ